MFKGNKTYKEINEIYLDKKELGKRFHKSIKGKNLGDSDLFKDGFDCVSNFDPMDYWHGTESTLERLKRTNPKFLKDNWGLGK